MLWVGVAISSGAGLRKKKKEKITENLGVANRDLVHMSTSFFYKS
jgi:hypothetical protein